MTSKYLRLVAIASLFFNPLLTQVASADEKPQGRTAADSGFYFNVDLPVGNDRELLARVQAQRAAMLERKESLAETVADREFDAKDVLITVIMPGGLLYAAQKKARVAMAEKELVLVDAQLQTNAHDLLTMHELAGVPMVAELEQ